MFAADGSQGRMPCSGSGLIGAADPARNVKKLYTFECLDESSVGVGGSFALIKYQRVAARSRHFHSCQHRDHWRRLDVRRIGMPYALHLRPTIDVGYFKDVSGPGEWPLTRGEDQWAELSDKALKLGRPGQANSADCGESVGLDGLTKFAQVDVSGDEVRLKSAH